MIGTEAYMAYDHRSERPPRRGRVDDTGGDTEGGKKLYYHLTLLAESDAGYRNLIQLASLAFLEGYYYKPRLDWELLERYHEGLIATTGCLGGHVLQSLLQGDEAGALAEGRPPAGHLRPGQPVRRAAGPRPRRRSATPTRSWSRSPARSARRCSPPTTATTPTARTTSPTTRCCACRPGRCMSDPKRFKFEGDEHYLKTAQEMRYLFRELPEACDNTLWIAERADVTIEFGKPQLPDFPMPPRASPTPPSTCDHLTFEGAERRWGEPAARRRSSSGSPTSCRSSPTWASARTS